MAYLTPVITISEALGEFKLLAHASGGQSVPQVVNAAPAPAVVKVTEANLPVALSDEDLDEVTGEWVANAVGAVVGGVASGAAELARQAASGEKTNWGNAAAAAGIGAVMGAVSPVNTAFAASNIIKAGIAGGTVVGAIQKK